MRDLREQRVALDRLVVERLRHAVEGAREITEFTRRVGGRRTRSGFAAFQRVCSAREPAQRGGETARDEQRGAQREDHRERAADDGDGHETIAESLLRAGQA